MNPISDGDDLVLAIIEYCDAQSKKIKKQYILYFIFCYVIIIIMISAKIIHDQVGITAIIPAFIGSIFIAAIMSVMSFGIFFNFSLTDIFSNQKIINLLNNGRGQLYADDECCIFSLFVPSKNKIYQESDIKSRIIEIIEHLRPDYARKQQQKRDEQDEQEDYYPYKYIILDIYGIAPKTQVSGIVQNTLMIDLEKIINDEVNRASNILPDDIKNKGLEMSEAYIYLYCVENSLRLFIDNFYTQKYGINYENSIIISNSTKQKISTRQAEEQNNKWVGVRGDSLLFYLDFKELGDIIINNKDILQKFPNEIWVKSKINELGTIRNLIAHNSYISQHEKDIVRINYHSILKQINNI